MTHSGGWVGGWVGGWLTYRAVFHHYVALLGGSLYDVVVEADDERVAEVLEDVDLWVVGGWVGGWVSLPSSSWGGWVGG